MQKAVNNITEGLHGSIKDQKEEITSKILKDCRSHMKNIEKEISVYFSVFEKGLKAIKEDFEVCNSELLVIHSDLNKVYAKRVLDWLTESREVLTNDCINSSIISVDRKIGEQLTIIVKGNVSIKRKKDEINNILQEDVVIKGEEHVAI